MSKGATANQTTIHHPLPVGCKVSARLWNGPSKVVMGTIKEVEAMGDDTYHYVLDNDVETNSIYIIAVAYE